MRPANIITAIADVLAGYAIAFHQFHEFNTANLSLLAATAGLYGGGVVLNDVFDARLDAVERPERPIPSGQVSVRNARMFGSSLLIFGCAAALLNHPVSGLIALLIALLAVLYDAFGKHYSFLGPLNMGMCRGGNLLLGMSANPEIITNWWPLTIIAVIYIAAVTMISRGEVTGGNPKTLYAAALLYLVVIASQLYVAYHSQQQFSATVILLFTFGAFIFYPLIIAMKDPVGPSIGRAVKTGIISLILMDAAWCLAFGNFQLGLITLLLLPASLLLSKSFAVT